jgi:L-rhamnose mutarotase
MTTINSSISFFAGIVLGVGICKVVMDSRRNHQTEKKNPHLKIPRRYGAAIKLRQEWYHRYTELHDAVWEDILRRMSQSNIRNFTIYYHEETSTMFQHFEWIGHWKHTELSEEEERALFQADMAEIAKDPLTRIWWAECEPCQEPFSQWPKDIPPPSSQPISSTSDFSWWANLKCLNHCGHWATDYSPLLRDTTFIPCNPDGRTTLQPII